MIESKHTPGPWGIATANCGPLSLVHSGAQYVPAIHFPNVDHTFTDEEVGNINLVVAAPDMKEALLVALNQGGNSTWMENGIEVSVHEIIRKALLKAGVIP